VLAQLREKASQQLAEERHVRQEREREESVLWLHRGHIPWISSACHGH